MSSEHDQDADDEASCGFLKEIVNWSHDSAGFGTDRSCDAHTFM